MNKESFDKIIQLNRDITIDDVKNAIEYYITLKDQKVKLNRKFPNY